MTSFVSTMATADVLVAGAGPVGLFLACELALAGTRVLVLEREPQPGAPLKNAPLGLRGLSAASAEALHRRGLLDALRAAVARRPESARQPQVGHFAGIAIDAAQVDLSHDPYRLAGPASTNLAVDMASLERVLAARAAALGVDIRRGRAVDGLVDHGDRVTVQAGDHAFDAAWLVGADGGRSRVRRLAGFEFAGTEPTFTAYSALVDIADAERLPLGRQRLPGGLVFHQPGQLAIADFDGGAFDRGEAITREHLQAVLRRVSGLDLALRTVHLATSFTDRARQATAYRRGRVLLAGDAAHVHSALGGQGLNAGLGDALNLGWKLAATVRGDAPADLLDTYHAERHPVGRWVLDWTRAQAALMRPGPQATALEGVVRALAGTRDGATWFAGQLWGLALRHDLGEPHPLAGRSAPEFAFADGTRLADHLRGGRGLLLDFGAAAPLRPLARRWAARVDHLAESALDDCGLSALLVRPDGIVAWAADAAPQLPVVEHALARWFGLP